MSVPANTIGPNVRRLIAERAAQLQIDRAIELYGAAGVGEVAAAMAKDGKDGLVAKMRQATTWAQDALKLCRTAPDASQYPTDEDMAAELLRRLIARRTQGGRRSAAEFSAQ